VCKSGPSLRGAAQFLLVWKTAGVLQSGCGTNRRTENTSRLKAVHSQYRAGGRAERNGRPIRAVPIRSNPNGAQAKERRIRFSSEGSCGFKRIAGPVATISLLCVQSLLNKGLHGGYR
jgi:hypothetical protein